ncbi:MAG: cache domain-containing protein [Desulfuromonadaceae bacterium]|nr:cache domain-containing protein [Desulfuromonadaceae bacterium]
MLRIFLGFTMTIILFLAQGGRAAENSLQTEIKMVESSESKDAQLLLAKAIDFYEKNEDKALAAFCRQGEFIKGDLYVYVIGTNGKFLASGGSSSALIGRDVTKMRDASGKLFFQEMIDTSKNKGSGTVVYRWLNRIDNKVERKVTYYQKIKDRIIAVGYYVPRASREQAEALLEKAVDAVKVNPTSAFAEFNDLSGNFVQDDLYVFVVDEKINKFKAHGVIPRLLNSNALDLKDSKGKPIIKEIIAIAKAKGKGTLQYQWRNPVTGKIETKLSIFKKVNNYIVAVGYYTR